MSHKLIDHAAWANLEHVRLIADHGWQEAPARIISHVVLATEVWILRTRGEAPTRAFGTQLLGAHRLRSLVAQQLETMHRLLRTDAERIVHYRRFTGEAGTDTTADIITHIMTHGCHHRGQIAYWFARRGIRVPGTDFIDYCRHLDRIAAR